MVNSRDITLLRKDVARNCRKMIEIAAKDGFPILVTGTVRDNEYQEYTYKNGYSKAKTPSFHADYAGLAFDICKNVKGQEYSDKAFWEYCGKLGKKIGFTWGGDWKSFVDKPHFQWDEHGKYTSAMIRNRELPPDMPEYMEVNMTYEDFKMYMDRFLKELSEKEPSDWSDDARLWAEENGIIVGDEKGDKKYKSFCTREEMVAFLKRIVEMDKK